MEVFDAALTCALLRCLDVGADGRPTRLRLGQLTPAHIGYDTIPASKGRSPS